MNQSPSQNTDKIEVHYRQQLSALIDGELPADEARFLLRRLQHDEALAGCQERWQLCGDVLRGLATAPAPLDFAARVQRAVAAEAVPAPPAPARQGWRWGGGAIAASVALVALFMARDRMPGDVNVPEPAMPVVATTAQLPAPAPSPADPEADAAAGVAAAVPAAALASARREATRTVASATRSQQAARSAASRRPVPTEARVANATAPIVVAQALPAVPSPSPSVAVPSADPFAHPQAVQARPWPRSALAGGGSPLTASFEEGVPATFYPFEPRQALPTGESEPAEPVQLPQR